jgi:RNA polymerase sigma factor (TIGR02999 family)
VREIGQLSSSSSPQVYEELRRLAKRYMGQERAGHALQTTTLVTEAYVRLIDASRVRWQNRAHFFAVLAQLMRRLLVDFARSDHNLKRSGEARAVSDCPLQGVHDFFDEGGTGDDPPLASHRLRASKCLPTAVERTVWACEAKR